MQPYEEHQIGEQIERTFCIEDNEKFVWHQDEQDRWIKAKTKTDWLFQFDNELPQEISETEVIFIKRHRIHRIISKTDPTVVIEIKFSKPSIVQ